MHIFAMSTVANTHIYSYSYKVTNMDYGLSNTYIRSYVCVKYVKIIWEF